MVALVALSLILPLNSKVEAQNSFNGGAIFPAIQLLLLDADDPTLLKVGRRVNRTFEPDQRTGEVLFSVGRNSSEVDLAFSAASMVDGSDLTLYLNGVALGRVVNGQNQFRLTNLRASQNILSLRSASGKIARFQISNISLFLFNGPTTLAEAQQFLMRATFGPRRADLERVLEIGYAGWIDEQLGIATTYTQPLYDQAILDRAAAFNRDEVNAGRPDPGFTSLGASSLFVTRMDSWWQVSIFGRDQLRQRVAYALSHIFNTTEDNPRLTPNFHDTLADNAFANYYDLLRNVSLTPKMGTYLSMLANQRATTGAFPTRPDENFAREVMQLFSIGLVELNQNGTPRLVNGKEVETYNQDTVRSFARVFTGWHSGLDASFRPGWERVPMNIRDPNNEARWHDFGAKTLLNGHVNPAGLSTREDFNRAMRNIADHPNVGPFLGTLLIKRLVKSNPSPAYVGRISAVFNDNGSGVRGDMATVIKAILLDDEAFNGPNDVTGGKVKDVPLAISQLWRAFNARSTLPLGYIRWANVSAQRPYSAPTVFGFFEPDFAPPGVVEDQGLTAPEFNLLTEGTVRNRLDELYTIATSTIDLDADKEFQRNQRIAMQLDYREALRFSGNTQQLIDFLDERLMGGLMSNRLRTAIAAHIDNLNERPTFDPLPLLRVKEALAILVASPEYLIQR